MVLAGLLGDEGRKSSSLTPENLPLPVMCYSFPDCLDGVILLGSIY